jgi:GDP-L-fucose synthase
MVQNTLITGARGFIGKNLVEYLTKSHNDKYSLFCPYHSELELLDAEKVVEFIDNNNIDVIIHCATVGGSRKTGYDAGRTDIVSKNLRMFFNLVRALKPEKRMIFLGSGAEYDMRHYKPRMNEDYFDTYVPVDDYGFSKYVCSKYMMNSEKMVNLRLFGVFGKYEDYEYKFISNAIVKNLLELPIVINQNVYFDYLYINDLVKIIEYFINYKVKNKFYNVTTGRTIDLLTIANTINQIAEKPSKIIINKQGLNTEYSGDNTKLLEELRGFNFTPFDEALEELYLWYKNNLAKIDKKIIEKDEHLKHCRTNL